MKKFISAVICILMIVQTAAFAEINVPMSEALAAVKQKSDIGSALTEFESRTDKYSDDNAKYVFKWSDKENAKGITISCDEKGRISYYSEWDNETDADRKLSGYSKTDAQAYAENLVKKLLPETFSDNDVLVCDTENIEAYLGNRGTNYNFVFNRQIGGICVNENYVRVNVRAVPGKMTANLRSNYDYDARFDLPTEVINDPDAAYKNAYPITLHYEDAENETKLLYSIEKDGKGYISAADGSVVKEKEPDVYAAGDKANTEASMAADSSAGGFSKQEIAELEATAGLKTEKETENILRGFSELKMTGKMVLQSSDIGKENGKYIMNLSFYDNDSRYMYVTADAVDGTIYSIGNYDYGDKEKTELTKEQEFDAKENIKKFFAKVSEKRDEFSEKSTNIYSHSVGIRFVRCVNGVEYDDNYAYISYDTENGMINSYSINYTDARFDDPEKAVGTDSAYESLLCECPVMQEYVLTDSDKYELCYRLKMPYTDIDALTGKAVMEKALEYSDIGGHWCASAVNALAELGIRLDGSEFKPDEKVTKGDLLRFFADGIDGDGQSFGTSDYMKKKGFITDASEESEQAKRSDAFVYMIKLAGYEKLAELDIYKVNFADSENMENIGYAAILSGMGVICGDGGYLRPNDGITRAEAAVMLYNYLMK